MVYICRIYEYVTQPNIFFTIIYYHNCLKCILKVRCKCRVPLCKVCRKGVPNHSFYTDPHITIKKCTIISFATCHNKHLWFLWDIRKLAASFLFCCVLGMTVKLWLIKFQFIFAKCSVNSGLHAPVKCIAMELLPSLGGFTELFIKLYNCSLILNCSLFVLTLLMPLRYMYLIYLHCFFQWCLKCQFTTMTLLYYQPHCHVHIIWLEWFT